MYPLSLTLDVEYRLGLHFLKDLLQLPIVANALLAQFRLSFRQTPRDRFHGNFPRPSVIGTM